jgi:hypothetical protein
MQPVTIASVRAHGVRQLLVYCLGKRFTCPARNADAEINEVGHAESSVFSADLGCFVARARAMRFTHGRQTLSQVRDAAFSRYPNRCVANSTSLADRCHLRPRHVGNPSTNDACLVRNDIKLFGHWHASSKLDASMLPMAFLMTLEQPYFVGVVKLQLSNKNVRIN